MKTTKYAMMFAFLALVWIGCAHTPVTEPVDLTPGSTMRETVNTTALDRYVAKPDPNYAFKLISTSEGKDWKGYVLEMTSQQWRTAEEVDRPIWKHWLTIVYPKKVTSPTAFLLIGGGSNDGKPPKGGDTMLRRLANKTNTVAAQIQMVPNEPLTFTDDGKRRNEDSIIAYTWDKYLKTGDEEWPLRLPMTKSVVRAMDTIQTFCATPEGGSTKIDSFFVAGGSKRGWATWTTAAVDKRVIACAPIVIDLLNVVQSFAHHWSVYGFWAPAINDYVNMGVIDWMGTKEYDSLMSIIDPYSYRDRLTMPKLIVNAGSDQFFVPTSSQFYIDDMKGPTYLCYVPNVGHGACGEDGMSSLEAFYAHVITGEPLPTYAWSFPDEQTTTIETPSKPTLVQLWQVTNPKARDFRIDEIGKAWTSTDLTDQGGGNYVGHVEKPAEGWTAFMVQLTFEGPNGTTLKCSSPIRVAPDVLPFKYEFPPHPAGGFLSK
ncbi:MAG: hypothetical protein QG656_52 [Candidatus Hydrogenedentes bacterium]|nr:hypothetical protein [Candidatus Hydrogenedentota bacterium]